MTSIAVERIKRLDALTVDLLYKDAANLTINSAVTGLRAKIELYQQAALEKVTSGNKLTDAASLKLQASDFLENASIATRIANLKAAIASDNTTVLYANISAAKDAFLNIKNIKKEREQLEKQKS